MRPAATGREPLFNLPGIVVLLSLAMIAIHLARGFLSFDDDIGILARFAFVPERYGPDGADWPGGEGALAWTFVSYAFLHADATHLLVNVPMFAAFGAALARRVGTLRFALFFVVSAAAAAATHLAAHPGAAVPVIGASGVVSGLFGAVLRFGFAPGGLMAADRIPAGPETPWWPGYVPALNLAGVLTSRRALQFVALFLVTNLILVLGADLFVGPGGSIAWEAHLGGFVAGLLLFPLFDRVPPAHR